MVLRSQVAAALPRRSQQGRIGPQVEARRLLSRTRRGPRPLLRQPGLSRLRPQSRGQCDRSLEYLLLRPRRRFFEGQGQDHSQSSAQTRFAHILGAHQSYRDLFLADRAYGSDQLQTLERGKVIRWPRRMKRGSSSWKSHVHVSSNLAYAVAPILSQPRSAVDSNLHGPHFVAWSK